MSDGRSVIGKRKNVENGSEDAELRNCKTSKLYVDNVYEKTSSHGILLNNNVTLSGSLKLPTTGGTASNLNFYEEYSTTITFTWTDGVTNITCDASVSFVRLGKIVVVRISNLSFTGPLNGFVTSVAGSIPSRFTPTVQQSFFSPHRADVSYLIALWSLQTDGSFYSSNVDGTYINCTDLLFFETSFTYPIV